MFRKKLKYLQRNKTRRSRRLQIKTSKLHPNLLRNRYVKTQIKSDPYRTNRFIKTIIKNPTLKKRMIKEHTNVLTSAIKQEKLNIAKKIKQFIEPPLQGLEPIKRKRFVNILGKITNPRKRILSRFRFTDRTRKRQQTVSNKNRYKPNTFAKRQNNLQGSFNRYSLRHAK